MLRGHFIYLLLLAALLMCSSVVYAQRLGKRYHMFNDSTVVYQMRGDFVKAAKYTAKMKRRGSRLTAGIDNFELARVRAMAGDERAALRSLRRAVRHRFVNLDVLKNQDDLLALIDEEDWLRIQSKMEKRAKRLDAKRNDAWAQLLTDVASENAVYKSSFISSKPADETSADSVQINYAAHGKLMKELIDDYGWPKSKEIGEEGADALFMVLQNQPFEVRQKYFKVIKRAAITDPLMRQHKAEFVDRLRLDQGKKQKYGTQYGLDETKQSIVLYPVVNPLRLDARRLRVGMEPIERWQKSINLVVTF
jgi:hypothetical protein